MAQARIVIRDEVLNKGQELLELTKLGSLTELFSVLVSRYGNHLASTWELSPLSCQCQPTKREEYNKVKSVGILNQNIEFATDLDSPVSGL